MLTIIVGDEGFDEENNVFTVVDPVVLDLEHSLVSLSKWESKFEKPFLAQGEKTTEEVMAYIKFMVVTSEIAPEVFDRLSDRNVEQINKYIESKQTATWFNEKTTTKGPAPIITSEVIYYWLTVFNIPFEVQNWNLNRLFTLLRVCNEKNAKPKKMTREQIIERNRMLNAERKAQLGTTG